MKRCPESSGTQKQEAKGIESVAMACHKGLRLVQKSLREHKVN